jgi:hypothetical protein
MLLDDLADFVTRHRRCGQLTGDGEDIKIFSTVEDAHRWLGLELALTAPTFDY